jgi:hypothetical protein
VLRESDPLSIEVVDELGLLDTSVFLNTAGEPIALFGTETDDAFGGTSQDFRIFIVTDIHAALGADNPALVAEALSLLSTIDPQDIALLLENPVDLLEFTTVGGISVGRWGNGNLLAVDKNLTNPGVDEDSGIDSFSGNDSLHFIYGEAPGPIPTTGSAAYNFLVGTNSTSASGATIGNGATSGFISVNFSTADAFISMDVDHAGSLYSVSGNLMIDGASLFDTSVVASTGTAGSACNPSCTTFIDGGFAGPAPAMMPAMPGNIGIEYEIQETDAIIGVAGFAY